MKPFLTIVAILICIQSFGQVQNIQETIYFQFNKTKLTTIHKRKLDSIASIMKASEDYNADIKGFADNVGSASVNNMMSKMRAFNAYNYLIDKGCNKNKLSYIGMGFEDPIGDNSTDKGRALNRRDEITVLFNMTADNLNTTPAVPVTPPTPPTPPAKPLPPPPPPTPQVVLGPNFTSGNIAVNADKTIDVGNGVIVLVDKNSLVTQTQDPIEFDFKDYTQNDVVINKNIQTKNNECKAMAYHGGFSTSFVQNYQDLSINRQNPVKVLIPGEYNANVGLYNFPRSWTPDTINSLTYNEAKKAYEVTVNEENQTFGLLEKAKLDTVEFLRVRIKGVNPKNIKPYIIYDDCSISNGCQYSGDNFIFPIVKDSKTYKVRASYKDFEKSSNNISSLKYDLTELTNADKFKITNERGVVTYRFKEAIEFQSGDLKKSDVCDQMSSN